MSRFCCEICFFPHSFYPELQKKQHQQLENYKRCQSFTLHFMDEQCLPVVETNYVVMYVWMNVAGIAGSQKQNKKKLCAQAAKNKRKTFSFSLVKSKTFHFSAGWLFFRVRGKENDDDERARDEREKK